MMQVNYSPICMIVNADYIPTRAVFTKQLAKMCPVRTLGSRWSGTPLLYLALGKHNHIKKTR